MLSVMAGLVIEAPLGFEQLAYSARRNLVKEMIEKIVVKKDNLEIYIRNQGGLLRERRDQDCGTGEQTHYHWKKWGG
ncbi:MAG: hypothetical protein HQK50_19665 [Oligoflexia bacterium]|nr:hypothetical protein [Oligoflexia bacterium]